MITYTRKSRYCKDYRTMRPIYECPKIVCLRKNRHITILSLFGGEIIFEVFQPMWSGYLNVQTDRQMDIIPWHHRTVKLRRQNVAYIIGIADI